MNDSILLGRGDNITSFARSEWEHELESAPDGIRQRLAFMSDDHHLVRNFVVRDLLRMGRSISVIDISRALNLPEERVLTIVNDLEENLFFLARPGGEEVSWAFPVTVEETGHHLVFSTGERLEAA